MTSTDTKAKKYAADASAFEAQRKAIQDREQEAMNRVTAETREIARIDTELRGIATMVQDFRSRLPQTPSVFDSAASNPNFKALNNAEARAQQLGDERNQHDAALQEALADRASAESALVALQAQVDGSWGLFENGR